VGRHRVATSGGGIWIPGSDQAKAAGFEDNLDDAFTYVRALSADNVPDENIRAYVDNAAPMLRWVTANTPVVYTAQPYPDYHAENPGGLAHRLSAPICPKCLMERRWAMI
jgi:3-oxosteroid 1-dehydrogenase